MFTHIKTSGENKLVVTELTRKWNLGPENIIARVAIAYSLSKNKRFELSEIKDSKGKEYSRNVLFGNNTAYYVALICTHYGIYKTDKDIAKYIKIHLDHGLELIKSEFKKSPTMTGFDFLINKVENGLRNFV